MDLLQFCGVGSRVGEESERLQERHFWLQILATLSINDLVPFRKKKSTNKWKRSFRKGTKIISTKVVTHINMRGKA
jgi:hypothetical protein